MAESEQPAGVAVDRGVRPSVWWREQRGAFEGPQTLAPMYLLGPEKPGSYDHGATYEPLYDQAALAAAVAAERERCARLAVEVAAAMFDEYSSDSVPVKQPYANNRLMHVGWRVADAVRKA